MDSSRQLYGQFTALYGQLTAAEWTVHGICMVQLTAAARYRLRQPYGTAHGRCMVQLTAAVGTAPGSCMA